MEWIAAGPALAGVGSQERRGWIIGAVPAFSGAWGVRGGNGQGGSALAGQAA
ncbi:Uncharacterised protein [uncultured Comamonas sp.]|nr:Uncharacterised protein [uncultured Comamonas sp.]